MKYLEGMQRKNVRNKLTKNKLFEINKINEVKGANEEGSNNANKFNK